MDDKVLNCRDPSCQIIGAHTMTDECGGGGNLLNDPEAVEAIRKLQSLGYPLYRIIDAYRVLISSMKNAMDGDTK